MAKLSDKDLFHYPGKPNKGPAYLGDGNLAKDKYKRPDKLLENPDAIVIGSGIGGLGIASILAQRKGWKVLLLEGNKVPGGCTHCHELGGYEFNSGIDSIGDMDPRVNRGLFRPSIDYVTDYQLDWAKMPDVHEISEVEGDRYEWHSSPQKNIDWVEKQFPGEGNVRKYYKLESAVEWWAWAWTVTKLLPTWIPLFFRELFYKVFGGKWRKYMQRTSKQVFQEELGFSDKLMAVYSYMYGNYGRPPSFSNFAFHAVNLLHYKEGAYYPVGGPGQIAECVVPILEKAGGQLAVDCRVKEIVVEGNTAVGVELDDGQTIRAPLVISDASAHTTFLDLLPDAVSKRHGYPDLFTQIRPSVAHLYIFLGYDEAIDLPPQIFWDLPRYDLEEADKKYKGKMEFDGMGSYLLSPSARDPVYAERYPDKSTVIVLAECPWGLGGEATRRSRVQS